MPNVPRHAGRSLVAFALWVLCASCAFAQGTDEQTAACSGDAFTLCRGDIPDVAKITACMRVHEAQLSPRCRALFHTATAPRKAPEQAAKVETAHPPAEVKRHSADTLAPKIARETVEHRTRSRSILKDVETPLPRKPVAEEAMPAVSVPERIPGLAAYRATIVASCRKGLIDPFTCRSTLDALALME